MLPPSIPTDLKPFKPTNGSIGRQIRRNTPIGKLKEQEEKRLFRLNLTDEKIEEYAIGHRERSAKTIREKNTLNNIRMLKRKRLQMRKRSKKKREEMLNEKKNLTNKQFGDITAAERLQMRKISEKKRKEMPIKKKRNKPLNLTNKQFGDITAAERIPGTTPPKWLCVCDYGHNFPVMTRLLNQGKTTTCPTCEALKQGKLSDDNTDTLDNKINDLAAKVPITGVSQETTQEILKIPSELNDPSLPEGIYIQYNNKLQSITQWAEETDIPIQTIMSRLYSKWSIKETFKSV